MWDEAVDNVATLAFTARTLDCDVEFSDRSRPNKKECVCSKTQ